MQFLKESRDIWWPGHSSGTFRHDRHPELETNFVLVSPIDKALHRTTGWFSHLDLTLANYRQYTYTTQISCTIGYFVMSKIIHKVFSIDSEVV